MSNLEEDHTLTALREPLQPVNLCQLMVNLADDFQPQGWDKNVHVSVDDRLLGSAPEVLVIKPLITQVFSNIIENAIKYSIGDSGVDIQGFYDARNDVVTVSVHNRGIPLRQEDTQRVFERGYRTLEAKNQYPAGTGFGLYIAKRIVESHQGRISATAGSAGSVFSVTLPVRALKGGTRQREPKDRSSRDDEQSFLEALEDALVFEGHRVIKARDVATALKTLRSTQVDLITIDIMLSPGRELEA